MKKTHKAKLLLNIILTFFFSIYGNAQESKTNLIQDSKIEILLKEKRKLNNYTQSFEGYKIQIFYGSSDESKKKLNEFKKEFKNFEATIVYTNPNFKVWIGNFETRLEAEKALLEIKKKYSTALLIKPIK
ncbi:SPOR domain-containing protein [Flavobacterium cucumis]|uniref:Sporulation related domain-containing protein n=1 Tax=Flavobacterium cucumis TaxID=416016 RepID=A0A1M7ZTA2_9FLAO|nr:SPOR domain-containing protein [Flavobacterium cucumis]SHO72106.1 Sporulation related domain-containing protein [Flavobacterium cucumis]